MSVIILMSMKYLLPYLLTVCIAFSCIKEQTNVPTPVSKDKPVVKTDSAGAVAFTSAKIYSTIVSEGAAAVTKAGIVWGILENPTSLNSKTIAKDGFGVGSFTSQITGLAEGNTYYVRTYATNGIGTTYSDQIQFTTQTSKFPEVLTLDVTQLDFQSFTLNGEVKSIGTSPVTERGFEYAKVSDFTNKVSISVGSGLGIFYKDVTGLKAGTIYYVRAFAVNSEGTKLGEAKMVKTKGYADGEGNLYDTITIGSQVWLKQNLKTTKYLNGDLIGSTNVKEDWHNSSTGLFYAISRPEGYGNLYNAIAVKDLRKMCPLGTHLPSNLEWQTLFTGLGDSAMAAIKLKTTTGWENGTANGTNSSGFSALPSGFFVTMLDNGNLDIFYEGSHCKASFWATASGFSFLNGLTNVGISISAGVGTQSDTPEVKRGVSVRCIED